MCVLHTFGKINVLVYSKNVFQNTLLNDSPSFDTDADMKYNSQKHVSLIAALYNYFKIH